MNKPTIRHRQGFWQDVIRAALGALGGEADMSPDVYDWARRNASLTAHDRASGPHQGRETFTHTLRRTASGMVVAGELTRVRNGRFRLS